MEKKGRRVGGEDFFVKIIGTHEIIAPISNWVKDSLDMFVTSAS